MKIIKCIYNEMAGNIDEARDKIKTAYELKETNRETAEWFCYMAEAHMKFNTEGHNIMDKMLESRKNASEYKANPEYVKGMTDVWKVMNSDLRAETSEVAATIDNFK